MSAQFIEQQHINGQKVYQIYDEQWDHRHPSSDSFSPSLVQHFPHRPS